MDRGLPGDDATELDWLLFRQSGVITGQQAIGLLSESALRHRVRSGRWQRVGRGVYLAGTPGARPHDQQLWIAVLSCGPESVLAGLTAAGRCGLRGFRPETIDILRPAGLRAVRPPTGVRLRRTTTLVAADINKLGDPPHTFHARSLLDAAAWAPTTDAACAIIAAGFQQRLVVDWEMNSVLERLERIPRRAVIRRAIADAAGGSHSLAEVQFLRAVRRAGLPEPTRQERRRDRSGRGRYLDAYFTQWRVHVEIDGVQHTEARAVWADMRRSNDLWIAGDRVLRFPAWLVRERPDEVIVQVRATLMAAGWRPPNPKIPDLERKPSP